MRKTDKKTSTKDQITYTIPPKGSLGLLAMGDRGLRAWREVRDQQKREKKDGE